MTDTQITYTYKRELSIGATTAKIHLIIEDTKTSVSKAGILYFRIRDAEGLDLPIDDKFVVSAKYGPYSYVTIVEGVAQYLIHVPIPAGAATIEFDLADAAAEIRERSRLNMIEYGPNAETSFDTVSESSPIDLDGVRVCYPVEPGMTYQIGWTVHGMASGRGLFLFSFMEESGEQLLPTGEFPIHPKLGPYKYVGKDDPDVVEFVAPPLAAKVVLLGKQWSGDSIQLIAKPELVKLSDMTVSASAVTDSWINALLRTDNLLLLHSTAGAISSTNNLLLRSNRTALEMSKNGWKVIYVPFGTPLDVDRLVNDNLIQITGSELVDVIDRLVVKVLDGKKIFICSSHADMMAVGIQNRLQDYGWKTVYEIRDDMEEFRRVGYSKWYSQALELRFAVEAEALIATSPRLLSKLATITGRSDIQYLPNAAPDELIAETAVMRSTEHLNRVRHEPRVGYLGHLTASWFDWQKYIEIVKRNPRVKFELIGHGIPDDVRLPLNVKYYGAMNHEECMPLVAEWTVGLIPFIESRLTYGVDPNKVYEYVAMGLQTVSSPMGDLENVPGVHLYRTSDEFNRSLTDAINFVPDSDFYTECNTFLESASWEYRVGQIAKFIGEL